MLRLLSLQAYNWGYAPFMHPLPIGLLTLCYGDNGSGKTTYLTGIGLLLGVSRLPKGKSYDHYVREGENWAFLQAVAANPPDATGKRPFDQIIPNPQKENTCTLTCMLIYKSGEWKRSYYIMPGGPTTPSPTGRVDLRYTFTPDKYRSALELVGVRPATMRLLELGISGLHDMHDPRRLFDFFVDLIGSESIRATYTKARSEWRKAQDVLENTQLRHHRQADEVASIGKAIETQRKRRKLEQDFVRYQRFADHANLRTLRLTYHDQSLSYQNLSLLIQQVEQELKALSQRRAGLQAEYREFERQQQQWKHQRDQAEHQWNQQSAKRVRADERARMYADTLADLRRPPLYSLTTVDQALREHREKESHQQQQVQHLTEQYNTLLREKRTLEEGRSVYPDDVTAFLQVLHAQAIPFHLVADAVHIRDPRWLRAIEGILGSERFTVIVENSRLRLKAKQLGERHHYRYWVSPPKRAQSRPLLPESLWEIVEVLDEGVAGWVEDLLWHVRRVETVEQGDVLSTTQGIVTVTPEAYRQEPRGGRSIYPRQLVCGQAARQARVCEITEELERVKVSLQDDRQQLEKLRQKTEALQEQEQRAREQQQLPAKEQEYETLLATAAQEQQQEETLRQQYEQLKNQEEAWADHDKQLALLAQELQLKSDTCRSQLQKAIDDRDALHLEGLKREIERLEATLPPLSPAMENLFEQEQLSASEYRQRIETTQQALDQLPDTAEIYDEALYEQQQAKLRALEAELVQARQRVAEHRDLFERAMQDYSEHIDTLFSRGMAREFRQLCLLANAQGNLIVRKSEDVNDWSLDVLIGFDGKNRLPLAEAPLSRGQEVLTSLYLVLAALRTVHATPILLLDELMSLLDESNAPKVLAGLKQTGVQSFVATPQYRYEANGEADILWGFSKKQPDQGEAPAIAVLVRRTAAPEQGGEGEENG
jgi:chromosome segregation ATPase